MKTLLLALFVILVAAVAGAAWSSRGVELGAANAGARGAGEGSSDDLAALRAAEARIRELETLCVRLRAELGAAEDRRVEREREFLRYTEGIARLSSMASGVNLPVFRSSLDEEKPKILEIPPPTIEVELTEARERIAAEDRAREAARREAARARAGIPAGSAPVESAPADAISPSPVDALAERSLSVFHGLRALLAIEQVTSLDLLESGRLQAGFTGPVVLRVLDERGRPLGSISAERMRLEASRSARMVTIVLERGYERRSGVKTPFEGGESDPDGRGGLRRIVLPDCDPRPWLESIPELFSPEDLDRTIDDGRFDLEALRASLNQLLRDESNSGGYRVRGIGGVQGRALREVTVEVFDREGRVDRRLYADRLTVAREASGIQLLLEGGSQIRGDRKAPFLDGRFRIFLPRASADAWEKAGIPGLAREDPAAPSSEPASAPETSPTPPPTPAPAETPGASTPNGASSPGETPPTGGSGPVPRSP